jgi:hypothetical protein
MAVAQDKQFPTPEEIRQRAAEIRKRWSPQEHRKRAGLGEPEVQPYVWREVRARVSAWMDRTI